MRLPPGIRRLLRLELQTNTVSRAVDDELRFHFDMTVRHLMSTGMSDEDARREAARRFGDVERTRARLEAIDRERNVRIRRAEWWSGLAQDLRYTVRGLRSRPAFTAVVVFTLALGVGANATMYGIVDRLLFRPPAYLKDPGHAQRVYLGTTSSGVEGTTANMSYTRYRELSQWTTSFSETAAVFSIGLAVGTGEQTAERNVSMVSASFWSFFGVRPALGRFFGTTEDTPPEGAPVAVLSYGYWQTRFGGETSALGKQISVGRRAYTIIGVTPKGFEGMTPGGAVAYIPITIGVYDLFGGQRDRTRWYTTHNMTWMEMLARRKPGVSIEAASADLTSAYKRSFLAQPNHAPIEERRPRAVAASILRERGPNQGQDSKVATWLVGVSIVVLLIACANVANLLLARAFRRRREIAVRVALGVSRGRLLTQLLTESFVLAVLGAIGGLAIAQWGGGILRAAILPDAEWPTALADSRMLLFAAAVALVVGLLTGIAPALQARRADVTGALKAGAREGTYHRSRTRTMLLVIQGALSVVLLVGAGLFVRSLRNVHALDYGYTPEHLLYVEVSMRGLELDSARDVGLRRDLVARARTIPGVEDVARTVAVPFMMSWTQDLFSQSRDSVHGEYFFNAVSPSYFATMGTRILRGRALSDDDRAGAPRTLVLSQSMARTIWPKEDALGKCLRVGADSTPCSTVVGIAEDILRGSLSHDAGLQYYGTSEQYAPGGGGLFLRARGNAEALTNVVRRELQRVMPGASYVTVRPLARILEGNTRSWKLGATMFALFGGLALLLAAVGLYSVIAYNVTQRSHELGVRIALGAQTHDVLRLVVGGGVRVAVAGVVIGGGIALVVGRFVAPLLYRVSPHDPAVFVIVTIMLLAVATLASLIPAMRATRVDPNVALRAE